MFVFTCLMKHAQSLPAVLYEDNHLLIVNKPAGRLVQGDRTGDEPLVETFKNYLKEKYHKPGAVFLGVVHRLDRPVSGVLVFARTSKALDRMNKLFSSRAVQKIYWAVVAHKPPAEAATLVHWLKKDTAKNTTTAYEQERDHAKRAELQYTLLGSQKNLYLLEVAPLTGRPHQIRVQLATMGCPIQGDIKYGFAHPNADGNISLHARKLHFIHPVKKEPISVVAPLPAYESWPMFANFQP